MSKSFEELDFQQTRLGELSLRRRRVLPLRPRALLLSSEVQGPPARD